MVLNAVDRIQDGTDGSWGRHDAEWIEEEDVKCYLEINICIWDDNTKMGVSETSLVFIKISLLKNG